MRPCTITSSMASKLAACLPLALDTLIDLINNLKIVSYKIVRNETDARVGVTNMKGSDS